MVEAGACFFVRVFLFLPAHPAVYGFFGRIGGYAHPRRHLLPAEPLDEPQPEDLPQPAVLYGGYVPLHPLLFPDVSGVRLSCRLLLQYFRP